MTLFNRHTNIPNNSRKRNAMLAAMILAVAMFVAPLISMADEAEDVAESKRPTVTTSLSDDTVMIGDHFYLNVEITKDMVQMVEFPRLENLMGGTWEILEEEPIDTLEVDGRMQRLLKRYRMISFQEGSFDVDSFPLLYLDKNIVDTIFAEQINHLVVDTYIVDTVNQTIFDIKAPMDTPLLVGEVSGYIGFGVLALAVLVAIIDLLARRMSRREGKQEQFRPREAPHVIAIRQLEMLNNQKIWQNNKHKLYYTRLTDILREYIDGRYGISAREMTSDEILDAVKELDLNVKDYDYLKSVLKDADLVKFAKSVPEAEQNEGAYFKAYYFVEDTKQILDEKVDLEGEPIVETVRPESLVEEEHSDVAQKTEERKEERDDA